MSCGGLRRGAGGETGGRIATERKFECDQSDAATTAKGGRRPGGSVTRRPNSGGGGQSGVRRFWRASSATVRRSNTTCRRPGYRTRINRYKMRQLSRAECKMYEICGDFGTAGTAFLIVSESVAKCR
ncbi:hypothetical protein GWI33_020294 [Rhynchophorus ferrugineus]|uniref:Uncharacterized protein n=1 Tax=Rhynchophorus ferrugineus TaxID=354439 RepID=A0A834HR76_RHYFE|nr:hypothetical protein GWI33_020294 [Rhynchophorus ferrugineus]